MNIDTLAGEATDMKGKFKESLGDATGDQGLQQDGMVDQLSGKTRKGFGALRDFARDQPLVAAAIAGIVGFALLTSFGGNHSGNRTSRN
jgi:uncharacterized protein YjbJ (UPF0337 family)